MTELKDTVELMTSEDYKERFKAEYWQLKIRLEKLHKMLIKQEAGTLSFMMKTPAPYLKMQEDAMGKYLEMLELRAELEGIDLES